jgi:hypothetical protein
VARHGTELSIEALNDMKVLERNILEALRLFPPLIMLLRAAKAPFAVTTSTGKTLVIPKVPHRQPRQQHRSAHQWNPAALKVQAWLGLAFLCSHALGSQGAGLKCKGALVLCQCAD